VTQEHPHAELSAYIDGALAPAAQAAVRGHLDTCALCRAHVSELRSTVALMQALPDPVPSRRLVPRLVVAPPAWLAPLRTLMTLASGAAVFLFIASSLVTNINFLASSGAATTANEASRDVAKQQVPAAAGAPATTSAPAPAASPNPAFGAVSPTSSQAADAARGAATDDPQKRSDQATAGPSGAPGSAAFNPQDTARLTNAEPQRSPLVNPLLWLALALISGAIAIALHRRLRSSV
jgi:Putative zinc-finger